MTASTPQALITALVDEFERRRWRDVDQSALKIVRHIQSSGGRIGVAVLAQVPSSAFLVKNGATRAEIRSACERALGGKVLAQPRPALIPIEEIDSFAKSVSVRPQEVAKIATGGLPIPERRVKEFITGIIGEPYVETDWGGELSDILTSRVMLGGRRVTAAFLLKGSGSKRKLRPSDLGKNGDQIRRLAKQEATLYIVQHVGQFDEAVYDQVRDMILARRAKGDEDAVGSVWDGSDCARLFVAHDLIALRTGGPLDA